MQKLPKFPEEHILALSLKTPYALENYEKLQIASQIKKLRRRAALTQGELAKKLKTSQSAVARMEAGKQNLSLRLLVALAVALGRKLQIRLL